MFTSLVAFKPYPGKPITAAILRGDWRVFDGFRYVREIADPGGPDHALVFEATVASGSPDATSCMSTPMARSTTSRPLSAATALAEAMGAQFEQIAREAAQGRRYLPGCAAPARQLPHAGLAGGSAKANSGVADAISSRRLYLAVRSPRAGAPDLI